MILAVDVGNSNIKVGMYRDGVWQRRFRIQTVAERTPDEYTLLFSHFLGRLETEPDDISKAVISSVVPPVTSNLAEMIVELTGITPLIVGPGTRTGLRIRADNPAEVGADLVANGVAAYERYKSSCIVVAFGTALTFTALQEPGDLVGVSIAPGLNHAAETLFRSTAQLRLVDLTPPAEFMGKNTIHSIQSGIVHGYVGLTEHLISGISRELRQAETREHKRKPGAAENAASRSSAGAAENASSRSTSGAAEENGRLETVPVIATGDQARVLLPLTEKITDYDPWLTLEGLRIIAGRN